jgi:pheromone shutdown-related protein TraB
MIELDLYRQQLGKIRESIAEVGQALNIEGLKEQLMELNETMNEPDFWNDLERSTSITKKARTIEGKLEHFGKLLTRADDVDATMELAMEMEDESLVGEAGEEIEKLKEDANLSSMMEVFAQELPQVHLPLIDERDRFLVAKMRACGGKNVVAVVGAGHVPGMQKYYHTEINTDAINVVPPPGKLGTFLKWLIPIILIGGIAYGVSTQGYDSLYELLTAWILPNSVFCFLMCILALAHPLTCLAGIIVSPITSTTPVIGAGIVLGLLEAWLRKPTVADCEDLPNLHTLKDFYRNRFTRTLIVCVLATFGSALGAWIGIGWLLVLLGVEG